MNGVMTSFVGCHYQPTLWDPLKARACPHKLTLLASSFGAKVFLNPKSRSPILIWAYARKFHLTNAKLTTLFIFIHYSRDKIFWKFLAFISLATWCGTFMWLPTPLKERWCLHHILRLLFAGLVWISSMASWACSISDSFTQDASIGWYPFHLTKYSRARPLSCLDLSMACTSNSGSLWTKSSGDLELCSRLGLEASQATDFKRKMWNVGWTLRFSDSSNL